MKKELQKMREQLEYYLSRIQLWRKTFTALEVSEKLGQVDLFHAESYLLEGLKWLDPEGYKPETKGEHAGQPDMIHIPAGKPVLFDAEGNFLGVEDEAHDVK
jgi:hypothetical protein